MLQSLPKLTSILPKMVVVTYIKRAEDGSFLVVNEKEADLIKILYPDGRVEFGEPVTEGEGR